MAKVDGAHIKISIHALREEGDTRWAASLHGRQYFYPRPPRGGRLLQLLRVVLAVQFLSTPSARRATAGGFSAPSTNILFLSTPSARRATYALPKVEAFTQFLSTPSARRATGCCVHICLCVFDFYPRPPRGGRRVMGYRTAEDVLFLSTPSARRATGAAKAQDHCGGDFYPRPPRGGRRTQNATVFCCSNFIHALREEGDGCIGRLPHRHNHFYPRPPRGGRHQSLTPTMGVKQFLSTPSARRATAESAERETAGEFLSTPSARRATITTPLICLLILVFLSTPSARRATYEAKDNKGRV